MLFVLSSIIVALRFVLLVCSAAVLGYALESFVDVWSSVLVLWRFWGDGSHDAAGKARQLWYQPLGAHKSQAQDMPQIAVRLFILCLWNFVLSSAGALHCSQNSAALHMPSLLPCRRYCMSGCQASEGDGLLYCRSLLGSVWWWAIMLRV
jgi:hypothetical protein